LIFLPRLAHTLLRGIPVRTKPELKERIDRHLAELNRAPVDLR
jgi:hypothetical protein